MRIGLLLILLFATSLAAQSPILRHYTVQDGLPSSNIYNMLEDSRGYIWFCTDRGIARFDGYEFEVFSMENINIASDVWGMYEDPQGRIWLSTFNSLVYFEDEQFHSIPLPKDFPHHMIQGHFFADKGSHYVHFNNGRGIHEITNLSPLTLRHIVFPRQTQKHKLSFFARDENGLNWYARRSIDELEIFYEQAQDIHLFKKIIIPQGGFLFHNPIRSQEDNFIFFSKNAYHTFTLSPAPSLVSDTLTHLLQENISLSPDVSLDGQKLFFDTNDGLRVYDKAWQRQYGYDDLKTFSAHNLVEDSRGNVWVYTSNDGVYFLSAQAKGRQYLSFSKRNSDNGILAMAMDKQGNLWLGLTNGQLVALRTDGTINKVELKNQSATGQATILTDYPITGLQFDAQNNLMIGYQNRFLVYVPYLYLNQPTIEIDQVEHAAGLNSNLQRDASYPFCVNYLGAIKSIKVATGDSFLITTSSGIFRTQSVGNQILIKKETAQRTYATVFYKNSLWGGTKKGVFSYETTPEGTLVSQFTDPINDLAKDATQKLWIATDGNGLFRYDGERVDTIAEMNGKSEVIKSLFVDARNVLWMATNKGIVRLETLNDDPFRYQLQKITRTHGLASGEVNQVLVGDDGAIYAAETNGLSILQAKNLQAKSSIPPLYFTPLVVNNQPRAIEPFYALPYDSNHIEINYHCLSYESFKNIEYQYFMEGVDQEWQTTKATKKEYSALPAGNYVFSVKARDINGKWTPIIRTAIQIRPPWWWSYPAFLIYFALFGAAVYSLYCYQLQRTLNQRELQRIQEVADFKNRFYTNITHEFRTPLTIILGFAKQLKQAPNQEPERALDLIQNHGNRLLTLVNQLLDLNRLEASAMPIHWVHQDIIAYLASLTALFESTAVAKDIQLTFYPEVEQLEMDFDAEITQTIVYNLLANAIKFTPTGGKIIVHVSQQKEQQLQLKISDTGAGIDPETLAFIFNRFYQGENETNTAKGSGIGLSLAKELVEHLDGTITVQSNAQGTQFTILLPIHHSAQGQPIKDVQLDIPSQYAELLPVATQTDATTTEVSHLPQLLIVEDNADLRYYLTTLLKNRYQIIIAEHGEAGMEKALEFIPDLIISDVMMPEKNGLELCSILKQDERTSHIPIILLTGKRDSTTKLQGLEYGADAYLTKPFSEEELLIRLQKLNELRQKLRARYANFTYVKKEIPVPISIELPAVLPLEDAFLQKVQAIVEEHLDDPNLNVQQLCKLVTMSRSQLHKKLTALTGESTTRFIRNIRLRHACELLQNPALSISEIAHQTGFEAPYFTTVFTKTFGVSPTAFRHQNQWA